MSENRSEDNFNKSVVDQKHLPISMENRMFVSCKSKLDIVETLSENK